MQGIKIMAINRTPHIDQEIWKLKKKDKPAPRKNNSVPPNLIDSPLYQRNLKDELIRKLSKFASVDDLILAQEYWDEQWDKADPDHTKFKNVREYINWALSNTDVDLARGGRVGKDDGGPIDPTDDLLKEWLKLMEMRSRLSKTERDSVDFLIDRMTTKNKPSED